jgi:hypothetical protein
MVAQQHDDAHLIFHSRDFQLLNRPADLGSCLGSFPLPDEDLDPEQPCLSVVSVRPEDCIAGTARFNQISGIPAMQGDDPQCSAVFLHDPGSARQNTPESVVSPRGCQCLQVEFYNRRFTREINVSVEEMAGFDRAPAPFQS